MLVTTAGRYALRALFDLAIHSNGKPVRIKDISTRQKISNRYLEQIFSKLFRAGLIRGRRGPSGGYVLAKEAQDITVADVVTAAEGSLQPAALTCITPDGDPSNGCELFEECMCRHVWNETRKVLFDYLNSVTLADLCNRASKKGNFSREACPGGQQMFRDS
ncbi:RrF2 family transcriptional regulator [Desulfomonile tiedjei]|uniref:Rrf2 family protein, putative transcriptional regulator n=1 Tax=Desulfomonile tiedjei (strain ATCC 49306 / DSM 6799 / DCB-1) TaxID=706587 RepID=I4CBA6_DESTA|nr:Rrf2 family transcriptional regulator [Desulfomonile tiedjei]AFM26847.1 rrf2 family protein, putative transcriptional regulator [Desulfomonile tiedjei DSM 6799]